MTNTSPRSYRRPSMTANDNVSRAAKLARREWVEAKSSVRGGVYHALHLIVGLADADGRFHVDGTALARTLKTSPRTVFNRINKLTSAGLIRRTGEKRWVHSIYQLTLPPEAELPELSRETLSPKRDKTSEQSGKFGAHKTPKTSYDQTTSSEVAKPSDWNRKRKEAGAFQSSAAQLPSLQSQEGAHLPSDVRDRFIACFGLASAQLAVPVRLERPEPRTPRRSGPSAGLVQARWPLLLQ